MTRIILKSIWRSLALIAILAAIRSGDIASVRAEPRVPRLSAVQDTDPEIALRDARRRLPDHWKTAWLEALHSPEMSLRLEAANAFLREHQQDNINIDDVADHLSAAFDATEHPEVRRTLALALVEFNYQDAAERLFRFSQANGTPASLVVEPALARWNYQPVRDVWLQRLNDFAATPRRQLLLAMNGVRQVGDPRAVPSLKRIVLDPSVTFEFRLPAAEALGVLQHSGLTTAARRLAADSSATAILERLMAVGLLTAHDGDEVQTLLLELARDSEPTVARRALRRLLEIDPDLVRPLAPALLENADGPIRRLAAQALIDRPRADDFEVLGTLLNDRHPEVRNYIRRSLKKHAEREDFNDIIRGKAMEILAADDWRGQEQTTLLLAELDHKEAAELLVQRLKSDRPEVHVTAAWGLRELAVPATLPGMLSFANQLMKDHEGRKIAEGHDVCLSHLFEAFGQMKYQDPDPLLRSFVPRRYDVGARSRGAATWALGLLYENNPQPDLVQMMGSRVRDDGTIPAPEAMEVRANAAISIGRMKAKMAEKPLRAGYASYAPGSRLRESIGWAVEQISGEDLPDPEPLNVAPKTPFLQPLRP